MSKVLVVDDDLAVLDALTHQLRRLGHEVMAASHPEHAIEMVEAGVAPELAIVEISMPDMTGFELAQILHENDATRRLPMLFFGDVIENPVTFTDEGVTARYVSKASVADAIPEAMRDLVRIPPIVGTAPAHLRTS